jgi:NAD(P)-dependent dehydrogenase (short-subunit alcohol dehydrogenase family)
MVRDKRVAVVTGAAGGIGQATVEAFALAGWHVVGVDVLGVEGIAGVDHGITANIAAEDASQAIFSEIAEREGRIDALVNNAAVQIAKALVNTEAHEWDQVMNVNVRAVFLAIRNAYPLMREQGGAIVNVSSVHARATSANIAAYAASKGALSALTRVSAIELTDDNIRVNAVLPGAVDTEMLRAGLRRGHLAGESEDDLLRALGTRHVIGRVGKPQEIAQAILFLADSERSGFMTGQELVIDGGATIRLSTE